ncbi:MAG: SEC-C metal-binding domain-containing protein [Actinomycetota bacterium]
MVDVHKGLPADVRSAIEAAPVGDKSLLELRLTWEGLVPEEKEAAERLRVFLITWDPFDWLDGRDLFFATTNGGDNWEIVLHLPLWNLEMMAKASEMPLGAALGQLGRAAVRVAGRYRDEIVRGRYPELVHEGSAPGLLSAAIVDLDVAVPAVAMVSGGWEPMGLGAVQDLAQDVFGPVDLDRSLVELSASAEPEAGCPACGGRRFGFPADLGDHRSAMCPRHEQEAGAVTSARLSRAELSNPDGWSAIGAACQAMERPHLPNGLRLRLRRAAEASDLGGGTDGDLRRDVEAVLELTAHFAGRPDDLAAAFDEEDWGLIDFFSCFPLNLAGRGLVDEAVAVGDALAEAFPELHMVMGHDVGVILAEAGRESEARDRLARNLAEFPTDTWTRIHAGDALAALGDVGGAETHFREAVALARRAGDPENVVAAYDRLGELFSGIPGREADLRALEAERRAWHRETGWIIVDAGPVRRAAPKVGRNDPCPCGSGRKYKRCCGA